ncbi:transketolase [Desulfocapsa sulfexigens DSM 10523]|uniref:Transketolase n=1 Tax=Desulfocapsa sulfexigens (strain DSM 10523 / SB164P1) TaxID=1167006 RepID=M1P773_DESSD|nr:transketolase [Desulfocapsa sulfexigens]AGF79328.1 transketolase [Desulfocapsa sulfexigens DSM 10523]
MTLQLTMQSSELSSEELSTLKAMRQRCAKNILLSTSLAGSGHPGGSLSTLDNLLVTYGCIKHDSKQPELEERDRVIMSIGHVSPGVYSTLAEYGYFTEEDFLTGFRRTGSGFPGHVERIVPGVEWDTGNLGQGLSTAVGLAHGFKIQKKNNQVIVFMGDGEHQKGQIVEAIRYASKYKLDNLIVVVDRNHLQICGTTEEVMPQSIRSLYSTNNWDVHYLEDGHDCNAYFQTFSRAYQKQDGVPTVIVSRTTMSKGISFMENIPKYHGSPLDRESLAKAMAELGFEDEFDKWSTLRRNPVGTKTIQQYRAPVVSVNKGEPILYEAGTMLDNRSAYGNALLGLAEANNSDNKMVVAGISCDLEGSVKMGGFHKHSPQAYMEAGIQEHHAATMAGGLSSLGLVTFFSTFGVFAVSEVYNQNRLNDFNHASVKVVATHVGLDVGEDGPTHQCVDYLGLFRNYFRSSVFMPADPNQTDRIIRFIAKEPGNVFVGMGRSKTPVITKEDGTPFFDTSYEFQAGKGDWIRKGSDATIITYGAVVPAVMEAWEILRQKGHSVAVLNMGSLLPVDREAVLTAADTGVVLTVEDHHVETGLGSIVGTILAEAGMGIRFQRSGVVQYGGSGKPAELYASQGLDGKSIATKVEGMLA